VAHAVRACGSAHRPFERHLPSARASVLVLGDSTGVGIGADTPERSLAGLLAEEYPHVEVVNRACAGATLADARRQLDPLPRAAFEVALLMAGGNDVLRHTSLAALEQQANGLLSQLHRHVRHTIWLGSANIGTAPLFIPPVSWWLSARQRAVCRVLARCASMHGAEFVDFFGEPHRSAFATDHARYFAGDGVHPSGESYRYCYEVVKRETRLVCMLEQTPNAALRSA
jgi:lysophospholipase L1-like esterase